MEFIDLNRHGEIGANSLFFQLGSFNLLVDAGLHPKRTGRDALPALEQLGDARLDCILLTHCHLDHLGALPLAAERHPEAALFTSSPNLTLAPRMLRNSINVMKRQRQAANIPEYPLFTHRDVSALARRLRPLRFGRKEVRRKKNGEWLEITLHPAGHVAGAAAVELRHEEQQVFITGDVLFDAQLTLPGARLPEEPVDTLVLETTRGAAERPLETTRESETARLLDRIHAILERGGSCLIPVFALGRMQELFKILFQARRSGRLPHCPIHAAGLGIDICNQFDTIRKETHLLDFDLRILEKMKVQVPEPNPRPGRDLARRGIYLVSSGMLVENTPSYNLAASLLPHPKNGLCFVGYCDPDTPGGLLLAGRDNDHFFFDALDFRSPLRASIDQFDLSGHADRGELVDFAERTRPETIILTHGEDAARRWFETALVERLPECRILNPRPLEHYSVAPAGRIGSNPGN